MSAAKDFDPTTLVDDPQLLGSVGDALDASVLKFETTLHRQRLGAARRRLARAKEAGDKAAVARLSEKVELRTTRLVAAEEQFAVANVARPKVNEKVGQVVVVVTGEADRPPLRAAVIDDKGSVVADGEVSADGGAVLTLATKHAGLRVQLSDVDGQVLYRDGDTFAVELGDVVTRVARVGEPIKTPEPAPEQLRMPDLTGLSEHSACAILFRLGVRDIDVKHQVHGGPPDVVIEHSPKAGEVLDPGARVGLVVSQQGGASRPVGPATVDMPDWVGHPIASVRMAAEELGIQLDVGDEPSDAARGTVIAQDPGPGTALPAPAKAAVTVSAGRETIEVPTVVVPVVVGMQLDDAKGAAKKAGLGLKVRTGASGRPEGEVLEQSPVGGTRVALPATLDVVVAAAEEEPTTVVVPDLLGQTPAAAQKVLKTVGLVLEVQAVTAAGTGGRVVRQLPEAGVVVDLGATVVVEVPRERPVRPARRDFVRDLTRNAAGDARLEQLGLSGDDLARRLRGAGIDSRDELEAAMELSNEELAARLELRNRAAARTTRSILKKALAALDESG